MKLNETWNVLQNWKKIYIYCDEFSVGMNVFLYLGTLLLFAIPCSGLFVYSGRGGINLKKSHPRYLVGTLKSWYFLYLSRRCDKHRKL